MADQITHEGHTFRVSIQPDDWQDPPWTQEDGHGPVSDWTTRAKRPGELILNEDRRGSRRYYDFAAAVKQARAEGWGFAPGPVRVERPAGYRLPTYRMGDFKIVSDDRETAIAELYRQHRASFPTARAYHAAAARADYERLRQWCDDQWCYVGVIVTLLDDWGDPIDGHDASLWGIESDAGEYLDEVARELAEEIIAQLESTLAA